MRQTKKECVAMLLAGGQGTRLGLLTHEVAKPAVPFGAKYKIIDFPLSNCANSGIDTVGVLTQYQPFELHQYIGNGQPWDLDRITGGVYVLPPFMRAKAGEWYKGTANAIYQNIEFIDRFNPEYVIILSGDHIYKMDYHKMMDHHKKTNADCTIAVRTVPMEEASRFGIMQTNEKGEIIDFEEKPKKPKSNKASMGIYVFTWEVLRRYLVSDEADPESQNDFGKNIIPKMLSDKQNMVAYEFNDYWKDVGTISSLWEANMDILNPDSGLNLDDKEWRIFARNSAEPPQFVSSDATIKNSVISEGTFVQGEITDSVISYGCKLGKNCKIRDSILMPGAEIGDDAVIEYAIVGWDAKVGKGARVGAMQKEQHAGEWKIAVVGPETSVKEKAKIEAGEMFGGESND